MEDVVHSSRGTARSISQGLDYKIAGKTGTAQAISIDAEEKYDSSKLEKISGITLCLSPLRQWKDPKIAIGLIVENGEHGGSSAAPIARAVFDAYMASQESATLVNR